MTRPDFANVLVCADDVVAVRPLVDWLQRQGHHGTSAFNTGEAYRAFQRARFDCLMLNAQFGPTPGYRWPSPWLIRSATKILDALRNRISNGGLRDG